MPDFIHYQVHHKNPHHGAAFVEGFSARSTGTERLRTGRGYTHIIGGLQFGSLELLKAVRAAGEPYVFFDRAYFGGGYGANVLRATLGAYQQNWVRHRGRIPASVTARRWCVELAPWRKSGSFVMVVPPSPAIENLYGIDWERDWMPKIRAATDREIRVSPKSDRDKSPLAARLTDCHCVVTWTSNVAVEAIVAGIPAYACHESAATPVAGALGAIERTGVEVPPMLDRSAWVDSLAWGQFTLKEIASGFASSVVMEGVCATA